MIHPRGAHIMRIISVYVKKYMILYLILLKIFLINVLLTCSSLGLGSTFTISNRIKHILCSSGYYNK